MTFRRVFLFTCCVTTLLLTVGSLPAEDNRWGHLTGRFVYDGQPPEVKMFRITKDAEVFGDELADESLLIDPETRGLANVVIYLLPDKKDETPTHPSYEDSADAKVELVTQGGRFVPHVLLLRTTQTMHQLNRDPVGHNPAGSWRKNRPM